MSKPAKVATTDYSRPPITYHFSLTHSVKPTLSTHTSQSRMTRHQAKPTPYTSTLWLKVFLSIVIIIILIFYWSAILVTLWYGLGFFIIVYMIVLAFKGGLSGTGSSSGGGDSSWEDGYIAGQEEQQMFDHYDNDGGDWY